jgi:hypothetical protein
MWASDPMDRRSLSAYCMFLGGLHCLEDEETDSGFPFEC